MGGFIHKLGLVRLGGASSKEIDAITTYHQAMKNNSNSHPISTNWYHSILGQDEALATDSAVTTRFTVLVAGACIGMGVHVSVSTTTEDHQAQFRINGGNNLGVTMIAGTTGSYWDDDLDFPFEYLDQINIKNTTSGGTGNTDLKITTRIRWD